MSEPKKRNRVQFPWWDKPTVYWHPNQIVLVFQIDDDPTKHPTAIRQNATASIANMLSGNFNEFLSQRGFSLSSFTPADLPRQSAPQAATTKPDAAAPSANASASEKRLYDLSQPHGKYLFRAPSGRTHQLVCFYHIGEGGEYDGAAPEQNGQKETDRTRDIVSLINQNIDILRHEAQIPILGAMPNWLNGSTGFDPGGGGTGSHGCPVSPPIPVIPNGTGSPSGWHYTLPDLPDSLQNQGDDVTVFVLDSFPSADQLQQALQSNAQSPTLPVPNPLLQSFADKIGTSITFNNSEMPDGLVHHADPGTPDDTSYDEVETGKDIYGRLVGFNMPDHGLFVAGIIHDLVPNARLELVRVLNDHGIGNTLTLIHALESIHHRMLAGDLHNKKVVINLSLVSTPPEEEFPVWWFTDDACHHAGDIAPVVFEIFMLRAGLHAVIKTLTASGAIVVASAGNDSDYNPGRDSMLSHMNSVLRMGPRYPAAFPEVISVGAIDGSGDAANYSNFPTFPPYSNGIATYGGSRPTPLPPGTYAPNAAPAGVKTWASVTDSPRGLYSAATYPELSIEDQLTLPNLPEGEYTNPTNSHHWAYWSGTSFATPIISAVAARLLNVIHGTIPPHLLAHQVQWALTTATGQTQYLGQPLNVAPKFGPNIPILHAHQDPIYPLQALGAGKAGTAKTSGQGD